MENLKQQGFSDKSVPVSNQEAVPIPTDDHPLQERQDCVPEKSVLVSNQEAVPIPTDENPLQERQDCFPEKSVPVSNREAVPIPTDENPLQERQDCFPGKSVPVSNQEAVPIPTDVNPLQERQDCFPGKSVPVSIRTEDRRCGSVSSASSTVTENREQNMGQVLPNLDLDHSLTEENPNKSSAVDHPRIKQWFKKYWPFNYTSLPQETPKKTKAVVTFEDLTKAVEVPTIRVKLKNPAKDKKSESTFGVDECVDGVFRKAEANLQLVQEPEKEALARNVKHLGAIFDNMEQGFRQKAEEFKVEFLSLTLEQQKEALVYWEAVGEILGIVLDWLCEVFYVVLAKIREGYVIEKDVLNRIFKMGAEMLKDLYSQPMNKGIQ